MAGFVDKDLKRSSTLGVWDFRKKDQVIKKGKYFMNDLKDDNLRWNLIDFRLCYSLIQYLVNVNKINYFNNITG
jgi:hypothetical protein